MHLSRRRAATMGTLVLAAAALLLGAVAAILYFGSEWTLHRLQRAPASVAVPTGGNATEGARLAALVGCTGCHGPDMAGVANCYEEPGRFRFNCPNVIEARHRYTDRDLANVIAFVRALPAAGKPVQPPTEYTWTTRLEILRGNYPYVNDLADYDTTPREGIAERGRYLASIACPECHAPDLNGYEGDTAPNLAIAKAYSPDAFARLMRTGKTLAGTESATGLMSGVARFRFSHFTDEEIAALKAYLDQRE